MFENYIIRFINMFAMSKNNLIFACNSIALLSMAIYNKKTNIAMLHN